MLCGRSDEAAKFQVRDVMVTVVVVREFVVVFGFGLIDVVVECVGVVHGGVVV